MRKIVILICLIAAFSFAVILGVKAFRQKIDIALSSQPGGVTLLAPSPTPTSPAAKHIDEILFVPYWSLDSDSSLTTYQTLVYFGIEVGKNGIDQTDDGFKKLPLFVAQAENQDKILTIRMLDSNTNFAILKDDAAQQKIINQSIALAKQYNFKGILLDIELSALPFSSLVDQINDFNADFAKSSHAKKLQYSVTAYGDTFYRVRPFDIKNLAKHADSLYVMAYDFSKAKGNPGPNFPLGGNETYGYDYERMINNFADAVPLNKLIVVFGLYGYDWSVDDKGFSQEIGASVALKTIEDKIITTCQHTSCHWERDNLSGETKAEYHDNGDDYHIVWFEDTESVKRKQDYLKKHGVGSYAYWAHSYF